MGIQRMTKKADFFELKSAPWSFVASPFVLKISAGTNVNHPSFLGIIASKKVGGAVQRNRAKRRLREATKMIFKDVMGLKCLIIARKPAVFCQFTDILRCLRTAYQQFLAQQT